MLNKIHVVVNFEINMNFHLSSFLNYLNGNKLMKLILLKCLTNLIPVNDMKIVDC